MQDLSFQLVQDSSGVIHICMKEDSFAKENYKSYIEIYLTSKFLRKKIPCLNKCKSNYVLFNVFLEKAIIKVLHQIVLTVVTKVIPVEI